MSNDWISDLISRQESETRKFRRSKKIKKFCNWVENATAPSTCAGMVSEEGTIYCSYHAALWRHMMTESQIKRKPKVDI